MKRKLVLLAIPLLFITTGCFKKDEGSYDNFKKKVKDIDSYQVTGELEIMNNENKYTYDVAVTYKKKDLFRVSLKNKINNHEQVILKNEEAVYVLTPSLNKSFKFQSDWPYNNSQSYLLQNLIDDVEKDDKKKISKKGDTTIIETKVNYSNNPDLIKQKIYLNKKSEVTKVEVLDSADNIKIQMKYQKIDYKPNIAKDYFKVTNSMDKSLTTKTANTIKDITYPMYMPENTYLQSQDKIKTINGERVILTFAGEKAFTLVEETVNVDENIDTIAVIGNPSFLTDTIGSIGENSATWISNDTMYYATSDDLNTDELLKVVKSISNVAIEK